MKYRTIVVDPPWPFRGTGPHSRSAKGHWDTMGKGMAGRTSEVPYVTMTVEEIRRLPVPDLAEPDAHLYLWTFGPFIPDAYELVVHWGFKPSALLTWGKPAMGLGFGGAFVPTAEHVLFARRGKDVRHGRCDRTWWEWSRPYVGNGGPTHSAKPEGFLDVVESVSPPAYLEMFARRNRLGWDTWGNECLEHVQLAQ